MEPDTSVDDSDAYNLLFHPDRVDPEFYPDLDQITVPRKYTPPKPSATRAEIQDFDTCQSVPWRLYQARLTEELEDDQIADFEEFVAAVAARDPVHVIRSEQDTAVLFNHYFLRPASALLRAMSDRRENIQSSWEVTLSPDGRTYRNTAKGTDAQLTVRPDVVFFLQNEGTTMDFRKGKPGAPSRGFAVLEFKRRGLLQKLVDDLQSGHDVLDDSGISRARFHGDSQLQLKQGASYALSFRTQFVLMSDLENVVLIQFHRMEIEPDYTPVNVWDGGHGRTFKYTVLDANHHAHKTVCMAGFMLMAADPANTPLDNRPLLD
ncbi:hypothetical protein LX32DRAFT_701453 [Colletotrichum zoysiae]|uniref:Uncharacterized protein n=1 Tax=Colletotrichum zoysiae TaxID=1216348 RepID=A0AAD9M217_9PEZI|nr:hypothetical protein LX32DRAFT_701453 [Colletotrichum zoysiae]